MVIRLAPRGAQIYIFVHITTELKLKQRFIGSKLQTNMEKHQIAPPVLNLNMTNNSCAVTTILKKKTACQKVIEHAMKRELYVILSL